MYHRTSAFNQIETQIRVQIQETLDEAKKKNKQTNKQTKKKQMHFSGYFCGAEDSVRRVFFNLSRLHENLFNLNCLLQICYHNKYGIMPYALHGGAYPYASLNTAGDCGTNDYCMSVGVTTKGTTAHGWSQNGNAYDSPSSDSDWPNRSYSHQSSHLTVWLK